MKQLENTTFIQPKPQPVVLPPDASVEQQFPQRPATIHSDVGVPFLQALITGSVISALVALILYELMDAPVFKTWAILTLAITSIAWLILLGQTRSLLYGIERVTGLDLNGDGKRGNPAKRTLEVQLETGASTLFIGSDWLEIDDECLLHFAVAVMGGRGLAEAVWGRDRAAFPRGINEYKAFRARLAKAGLIRQVNPNLPNSAYVLSPSGRAVFGRLVAEAQERGLA